MEKLANATLGGGCFWCLEAVYSRIDGVKAIAPGFAYFGRDLKSHALLKENSWKN